MRGQTIPIYDVWGSNGYRMTHHDVIIFLRFFFFYIFFYSPAGISNLGAISQKFGIIKVK